MSDPHVPEVKVKCTYKDCDLEFDTVKQMRKHKKVEDEHDYCTACDLDFDSPDDLSHHKIFRPTEHNLACRICGDEFKSKSGLNRHIELNHKIDQNIPCLGCRAIFHRASVMVEHLEFGHCPVVSGQQFMGHIVHKNLVTELLKGGNVYERFMQKIAKFDAAQDFEEEGGVGINDPLEEDEHDARDVEYEAIQPEYTPEESIPYSGPYPPLPSQQGSAASVASAGLTSTLGRMSLRAPISGSSTVVGSTKGDGDVGEGDSVADSSSTRRGRPWAGRSSKTLFPNAKPTPPPSEFSIAAHDQQMEKNHGINIMNTRFWDPNSDDFNAERFYEALTQRYLCPFPCEQTFEIASDLTTHIVDAHRITRMRCPSCLKQFKSVTSLMAHCESRGSRCQINKAEDFGIFLSKLTGGFLSVREQIRPDHLDNPKVEVTDPKTSKKYDYTPPVARYLQYSTSRPVDWKDPTQVSEQIGGGGTSGTFDYQGRLSRW